MVTLQVLYPELMVSVLPLSLMFLGLQEVDPFVILLFRLFGGFAVETPNFHGALYVNVVELFLLSC